MILYELRRRKIDESFASFLASYLSERMIILDAEGKKRNKEINSDVPQGSVLGPTIWNVQYNSFLEVDLPEGVKLIGFADDVAMVVVASSEESLMHIAETASLIVVKWRESRKFDIAPQKIEAGLLNTKRKIGPIYFNTPDTTVHPRKCIRQLGIWLETKLKFAEHIDEIAQRAEKTMMALAGLMPNIRGPRASKRRVLTSVVHSQILYAALFG